MSDDNARDPECICYPGMCPMGCEPACPACFTRERDEALTNVGALLAYKKMLCEDKAAWVANCNDAEARVAELTRERDEARDAANALNHDVTRFGEQVAVLTDALRAVKRKCNAGHTADYLDFRTDILDEISAVLAGVDGEETPKEETP